MGGRTRAGAERDPAFAGRWRRNKQGGLDAPGATQVKREAHPRPDRRLDLDPGQPLGPLLGVARRRVSQLTADLERRDLLTAHRIEEGRRFVHTESVHGFLAALADQARPKGLEMTEVDPPHRASRYFRLDGRPCSVQPDAFGVLRCGGRDQPFFLEWERRAIRPSTMAAKLAPYLRYHGTHRPTDDHGVPPLVLFAFEARLSRIGLAQAERKDRFLVLGGSSQDPAIQIGVQHP